MKLKPNRTLFGNRPYLHIYYFGERFYDSTKVEKRFNGKLRKFHDQIINNADSAKVVRLNRKIKKNEEKKTLVLNEGNWLMRVVGEPPALYDSSLSVKTMDQFKLYMFSKGFLNAEVDEIQRKRRSKMKIIYSFAPDKPFKIRRTKNFVNRGDLRELYLENESKSYVKANNQFSMEDFEQERARLNKLFKNHGYFHFSKKYIRFELDTTVGNNLVDVTTVVKIPRSDSLEHFSVDKVLFNTGNIGKPGSPIKQLEYNAVNYTTDNENFATKVLDKRINLKANQPYSLDNTLIAQERLANLNMFKFINITYVETSDTSLNCVIKTSPFKKNEISTEIGVNVFQSLPGPYGNISFKTRNLLNRAETFQIGVQGLIEGQASPLTPDLVYRSQEISSNISLTFPYFFGPIHLPSKSINDQSRSIISSRFSYIVRPEFRRTNLTSSLQYTWRRGLNKKITVSPFELSVINTTDRSQAFSDYLDNLRLNGNNLYLSFNQSIVTSLPISFTYNDYEFGKIKKSKYLRVSLESGGSVISMFNDLVGNSQNTFLGLDIFQYFKGFTDFRYYLPVKHKNIIASRISFGIAKPIGGSTALPYEKYFFTGGSYNNRAWLPRRLGPGSYIPDNNGTPDFTYSFEQPGELIIESNIEYRFPVSGFINSAFFVDASNVWLINDSGKSNSKFEINNFYKQFGIGAGFGLRFDFSFLVLRLDWAKKIYDPALDEGERLTLDKDFFNNPRLTVLNLGIGYPF